jgi:hypothetical protein
MDNRAKIYFMKWDIYLASSTLELSIVLSVGLEHARRQAAGHNISWCACVHKEPSGRFLIKGSPSTFFHNEIEDKDSPLLVASKKPGL